MFLNNIWSKSCDSFISSVFLWKLRVKDDRRNGFSAQHNSWAPAHHLLPSAPTFFWDFGLSIFLLNYKLPFNLAVASLHLLHLVTSQLHACSTFLSSYDNKNEWQWNEQKRIKSTQKCSVELKGTVPKIGDWWKSTQELRAGNCFFGHCRQAIFATSAVQICTNCWMQAALKLFDVMAGWVVCVSLVFTFTPLGGPH